MKRNVKLPLLVALTMLGSHGVHADDETPVMIKSQSGVEFGETVDWAMCNPDGVALGGFDAVSYRQDGGPTKGDAALASDYDGATYWFVSEANRTQFLEAPTRYLPAYSGFCAITLALGRVTCPDYTNFKIEGDQLFLFEVTGFTNGRTLWNSDSTTFRKQADGNFDRLLELN